ncbi:hypothetical protein KVR01_001807 [Diaporthe batatas]|uniref:uncharacterized protein n=1 Tax=Diaporthe batatas TaxID=748121 RepID=UPI001D058E1C|nr:uncharacterized protein KVR01_001807 [Diaporthe batatas]KAG8169058.1 hypothetical protein KVR01_001807 [Diaporthe batatas]
MTCIAQDTADSFVHLETPKGRRLINTLQRDRGSFSNDGFKRDSHDDSLGQDYHEAERFWATDGDWAPANLRGLSDSKDIDRILELAIPRSPRLRNIRLSPRDSRESRPSKSRPAPETLPSPSPSQSMEEDPDAVAFDEALDRAQKVEHQEPNRRDEPPQAKQADVLSRQRLPPVLLGRRDQDQREILRSMTKREGVRFSEAFADFISWKRLLKEISNPESQSPSSVELRMHRGVLALDSADSMATFLSYSSPDHKQKARNRILLYTTLRHAPEKGAIVLKALLSVSRLPFYMIEDSLGFLAYHLRQMPPAAKQNCAQMLADLAIEIAQYEGKRYVRLSQSTIYYILDAIPPTQLEDWYYQLVAHKTRLHKYTLLHFASRFAKMPATKDLSLDIAQDLFGTRSPDINTPLGTSLCTSLLSFTDDDLFALDENLPTPAEIFQALLDCGLVPNVITYTTIIHSLCVKKDLHTAMEVFGVMKQHGIQPDRFTYSVMMNGFKSCGDFATMLQYASDARAEGFQDAVVWNDLIHAVFLACLKEPRQPGGVRRARCAVWGPMNAIFSRFFRPEPLRTFITAEFSDVRSFMEKQGFMPSRMQGAFHNIQQLPPLELIQPTSSTLSLMILGFLRHLPRPNDVVLFYDHFKSLLREGDPVAQSIVQEQGSIVHDVVLRSLIKWKGTLRIMLSIIRDMMTDIQPAAAVAPPSSRQTFGPQTSDPGSNLATNTEDPNVNANIPRSPIRHPRPSIYTWSILLKAYFSNGMTNEAEHVLKLMQLNGVKPNIVTWNTLAAGYAKLGHTKQAVDAMRRLEGAGFTSDDWTMRAFSYIGDKDKAIRLMEQKVEENKAAIEEDESGQQQVDEDEFDEIVQHQSEAEENGMALHYEGALETRQEADEWPAPGNPPSTGEEELTEAEAEAEAPGRSAEESQARSGQAPQAPQLPETQKPLAKAPAPPKPDLGAWDAFLWDHAAEPESEEQDEPGESAA